jgi:hypothetical protein
MHCQGCYKISPGKTRTGKTYSGSFDIRESEQHTSTASACHAITENTKARALSEAVHSSHVLLVSIELSIALQRAASANRRHCGAQRNWGCKRNKLTKESHRLHRMAGVESVRVVEEGLLYPDLRASAPAFVPRVRPPVTAHQLACLVSF